MIKKIANIFLLTVAAIVLGFQSKEPWKASQMISTYTLNKQLKSERDTPPIMLSVGPKAVIKGSINIGPGQEEKNIEKLEKQVAELDKGAKIIIYCGCCPLRKCPNIRPAFKKLNDLGFTNHMLLAILKNIKTDWIDKGYPTVEN